MKVDVDVADINGLKALINKIGYEVEWIYKKGFVRTGRTVFFSNSDIEQLKLN